MPITAAALGARAEATVEVSKRWLLAYAAGIGYSDACYLDDTRPDLVVPLTFCASLEWALHGHSRAAQLGLVGAEQASAVHVLQSTTAYAPFRPDARVHIASKVTHLRPTSAGIYVESVVACHEAGAGRLLTETLYGALFRGVRGLDRSVGEPAEPPTASASEALPVEQVGIPVDAGFAHVYSECARIWNPIHTEQVAARAAGLPGVILHGSATWALAGRAIVQRHLSGDAGRLMALSGRMRKPVIPGTRIGLALHAPREGRVAFEVMNHLGEIAIEAGCAVLRS